MWKIGINIEYFMCLFLRVFYSLIKNWKDIVVRYFCDGIEWYVINRKIVIDY